MGQYHHFHHVSAHRLLFHAFLVIEPAVRELMLQLRLSTISIQNFGR
jgi:hypothetical protein